MPTFAEWIPPPISLPIDGELYSMDQIFPKSSVVHKHRGCVDIAYRVERVTVGEDELNISNKLLDTLVMVEVCFAQTTPHSP